nr:MAG TPA: hypothetical protein [Caudoviricetes sp.]
MCPAHNHRAPAFDKYVHGGCAINRSHCLT